MSIIEVAKIAGVSKTTVSRVLNEKDKVPPETVDTVYQAIKKLNYQIPIRKRGPKKKIFSGGIASNLALIIAGYSLSQVYDEGSFAINIIRSIEKALAAKNLNMTVICIEDVTGKKDNKIKLPTADGCIIIGREKIPEILTDYVKKVPAVFIDMFAAGADKICDSICFDNRAVGKLAADYLAKANFRNVACICPYAGHRFHTVRNRIFGEEAEKHGLNGRVFDLENVDSDHLNIVEKTYLLVNKMLDEFPEVEAVFVSGDRHVINVYMALLKRGIMPMKDIFILTCENNPYHMQQLDPRPPVIDCEAELIGAKAFEQLVWRMKNRKRQSTINTVIEPAVVEPWPETAN